MKVMAWEYYKIVLVPSIYMYILVHPSYGDLNNLSIILDPWSFKPSNANAMFVQNAKIFENYLNPVILVLSG